MGRLKVDVGSKAGAGSPAGDGDARTNGASEDEERRDHKCGSGLLPKTQEEHAQRYILGAGTLALTLRDCQDHAQQLCLQFSSLPEAREELGDLSGHCKFLRKAKGSSP